MKLRQRQKKFNSNRLLFTVLALGAVVFAAACGDEPKAPENRASAPPPLKQQIAAAQQAKPAVTQPEPPKPEYSYNPAGRRDPFMPLIVRQEEKKPKPTVDRPPLERYDVSDFRLTGIVWGGFGYNAMLEGPDGKGYFVRVGSVVGQNRGTITKITKNSMVIEERYKDSGGSLQRKEIVVELRKRQEGTP